MSNITNLKQWSKSQPSLSSILKVALNLFIKLQSNQTIIPTNPIRQDIFICKNKLTISSIIKQQRDVSPEERKEQQCIIYEGKRSTFRTYIVNMIYSLIYNMPFSSSKYEISRQLPKQYQSQSKLLDNIRILKYFGFDRIKEQLEKTIQLLSTQDRNTRKIKQQQINVIISKFIEKIKQRVKQCSNSHNKKQTYEQIIKQFNNLDNQQLSHWRINNAIGVIYQLSGSFQRSLKYYKQAQKCDTKGTNLYILMNLCSLYYQHKQQQLYKDALQQFSKIKTQNWPSQDVVQFKQILADASQLKDQQKLYINLIQHSGNEMQKIKFKMKKGEVYFKADKFKQCKQELKQIKRITQQFILSIQNANKQMKERNQQLREQNKLFDSSQIVYYHQLNNINLLNIESLIDKKELTPKIVNQKLVLLNLRSNLYLKVYADTLLKHNQFNQAKGIYLSIKNHYQNDYSFNWNLGKCFFQLESLECYQYFKKCYEISPDKKPKVIQYILKIDEYFKFNKNIQNNIGETDYNKAKEIVKEANNYEYKK